MRIALLGSLVVGAWALALAGCGTYENLRPEAGAVTATTTRPQGKCDSLGSVTGKGGGASGGYVSNEDLIEFAVNDMRNRAARLGATHVVYSTPAMGGASGTTTSAMVMGEALRCEAGAAPDAPSTPVVAPAAAVEAAPATGGCAYDTQCKGDRVCVNHECVSPAATKADAAPAGSVTTPIAAGATKP